MIYKGHEIRTGPCGYGSLSYCYELDGVVSRDRFTNAPSAKQAACDEADKLVGQERLLARTDDAAIAWRDQWLRGANFTR